MHVPVVSQAGSALDRGVHVLSLKIIVGSTRPGRAAELVLPWVRRQADASNSFDIETLDLREWELPMFAETLQTLGDLREPSYSQPLVKRWNTTIESTDAVLFVTPEYNHSIPAVLKNAIDTLFFSFALRNKPAAFVAYSRGAVGGARAVEHLAHIAIEAEMVPLRNSVLIPHVQSAFTANGKTADPATSAALAVLLQDLEWWAQVLHDARSSSLPPAIFRRDSDLDNRAAS
jgi:NAD(P)H-dependent FMN reductase